MALRGRLKWRLTLLWGRTGYRPWAKLLHRFNLHHTKAIGPMQDGTTLHRCEWCGVSRVDTPMWLTVQRMKDRATRGSHLPVDGREKSPSGPVQVSQKGK